MKDDLDLAVQVTAGALDMSTPPTSMVPDVGTSSPTRQRANVVFPDPDSPTSPTLSFTPMSSETPANASLGLPPCGLNTLRRSRTLSSGLSRPTGPTGGAAVALMEFAGSSAADGRQTHAGRLPSRPDVHQVSGWSERHSGAAH